jgi:hypothetical protein
MSKEFEDKADAAVRRLKDQMGLKHSPASDRQPSNEPPPGSYAAQLIAKQREEAQLRFSTGESETGEVAPPDPEGDDAGQVQEVGEDGKPVQFNKHPIYDRFKAVTAEARERKERIQKLEQDQAKRDLEYQKLQEQLQALQEQHSQVLQQNLEHLEPEQRTQVLLDARLRSMEQEIARRVDDRLRPALQMIRTQARGQEIEAVIHRYPRFDPDKHIELIEMVQAQNPGLTVEMAFKAVADPDELVTNGQSVVASPPPVVPPGRDGMGQPRYIRQTEDRGDKLREGAQRVREIAASNDPRSRTGALRAAAQSIKDRLL